MEIDILVESESKHFADLHQVNHQEDAQKGILEK